MITHNGTEIKCGASHSKIQMLGGPVQGRITYFWGLKGNSEIISDGVGYYELECEAWINDSDSFTADEAGLSNLQQYMKELRALKGDHGELQETFYEDAQEINSETWQYATFYNVEPVAFPGQERTASPIIDHSGLIGGWILQVRLSWKVLLEEV